VVIQRRVFLSYAWGGPVADALCQKLETESWEVIRDKTAMHPGDLISDFMKAITRADLVVVVLSDKYLRSPYCMTELYGIYQRVQGDKSDFLEHVIPLALDDAKISSWRERAALAEHWEREFKEMEKRSQHLGVEDFKLYKAMQDWHNHVGDMLAYVGDKLHPHGFEQIVENDFAALMRMLGGKPSAAEQQYLKRLIDEIEAKARLYSPLAGIANTRPNLTALDPWKDDPGIELLIRHQTRKRETDDAGKNYDDILTAFGEVPRAALLGAPGAGKSTTLRKLALELARRALAEPKAPYANREAKGTHRAIDRLQHFARKYRYALRLDVVKHIPSIDHAILLDILGKTIADERILKLAERIIASGDRILEQEYEMVWFPGDDLFAICRPRGLPIGNLTSQFWSNCYLNPLDQFIKRELRCAAYLRYVDDMALLSDSKQQLWEWKSAIVERLQSLRLTIHGGPAQAQAAIEGIPWLGFVVFPTHRRLKARKTVEATRRLSERFAEWQEGRKSFGEFDASVQGWINHVRYANTWGLRRCVLDRLAWR
jgi:hypothetical protein